MTMNQRKKWEKERIELEEEIKILADELIDEEKTLDAVKVIITTHYVLGSMTAQEAIYEICKVVYPESTTTARKEE